jgi:hypothetical protein
MIILEKSENGDGCADANRVRAGDLVTEGVVTLESGHGIALVLPEPGVPADGVRPGRRDDTRG